MWLVLVWMVSANATGESLLGCLDDCPVVPSDYQFYGKDLATIRAEGELLDLYSLAKDQIRGKAIAPRLQVLKQALGDYGAKEIPPGSNYGISIIHLVRGVEESYDWEYRDPNVKPVVLTTTRAHLTNPPPPP